MMAVRTISIALASLCFSTSALSQTFKVWTDAEGDAVVRKTDPGATLPINAGSTLPDVTALVISGWSPIDPVNDPFTGSFTNTKDAHLFRLDIVFAGLVNPPGPLDSIQTRFKFGPSPVYGFLDLDVDSSKDTGGELTYQSENRYLANIARFGRLPYGSIGGRAAQSAADIDADFYTAPFYERTGADFAIALCGCWNIKIISQNGNGDGIFDEGETWLVEGRFLERSQGYAEASSGFGGSAFGHWDPLTTIQFRHDIPSDTTIISIVAPLDMLGAASLRGEPEQIINFNFGDHTAIIEALNDIIEGASGQLFGPVFDLTRRWKGREPEDSLDVDRWDVTALFGTTYIEESSYVYVWTDTGFDETPGDVNSDGFADVLDMNALRSHVYANDGTAIDADGTKNGQLTLINPGINFSLFDLDGDYIVDGEDLWLFGHRADLDKNGKLDIFDFLAFQNAFTLRLPLGDFNLDEQHNIFDVLAFQDAFTR